MDLASVQRWLDAYVAAWRSNEPKDIQPLFADDAVYYPTPYEQPLRGPEAIATAWIAEPDPPDSWTADYRAIAANGDLGVGEGVTRYQPRAGKPEREFANVFVLRFDEQGRCREYMEWWVKRPPDSPTD